MLEVRGLSVAVHHTSVVLGRRGSLSIVLVAASATSSGASSSSVMVHLTWRRVPVARPSWEGMSRCSVVGGDLRFLEDGGACGVILLLLDMVWFGSVDDWFF